MEMDHNAPQERGNDDNITVMHINNLKVFECKARKLQVAGPMSTIQEAY